jgi:hypothetical protein
VTDCLACRWPHERREHTCAVRTDPAYAQHLTPEAAAWLESRHDPRFKPRKTRGATGKPPKLSDARREKLTRENLARYGTPRQIAEYNETAGPGLEIADYVARARATA